MNRDHLIKAIKQSYRRLEYGANPIRIEQETDDLIDQLAALPGPARDITIEPFIEVACEARHIKKTRLVVPLSMVRSLLGVEPTEGEEL